MLGSLRRSQDVSSEVPGGPRMSQDALGGPRRSEEFLGSPKEVLGGPRRC